jgi:CDP-glucose 4,6-dehydratase
MEDEAIWGEAFNFGTEHPMSVLDVVQRIACVMGCTAMAPEVLGQATDEIPHQWLCCEKARRLLQWTPCYDLERGLAEAIPMLTRFFADQSARRTEAC